MVFEPETSLKDLVVELLRREAMSISAVQRELEKEEFKFHRLVVTGYLKALADVGFLEERDIPPSKVYAVKPGTWQRDLYQELGRVLAELGAPEAERPAAAVYVLERLFHRPVFKRELQRAGLEPARIATLEVSKEDREEARRVLAKTPMKPPPNDPAYSYAGKEAPEALRTAWDEALAELVRTRFHAHMYTLRGKQVTLGEV